MASFTIDPLPAAIFGAIIRGSRQETGDLQRLTLGVVYWELTEWQTLRDLVTTKYAVHAPLGGDATVVDVVRGPGEGILVIENIGETAAILIALERSTYLPYDRTMGSATFLVTGDPV